MLTCFAACFVLKSIAYNDYPFGKATEAVFLFSNFVEKKTVAGCLIYKKC